MEIWKNVKNYEGIYQISNLGKLKKVDTGKIMKPSLAGKGYYRIGLRKDKKSKYFYIHRLVAEAFIPNVENKPCVNHKDLNKLNNCVDNLEWCTIKENNNYREHQLKRTISTIIYYIKNNYPNEKEIIEMLSEVRKRVELF